MWYVIYKPLIVLFWSGDCYGVDKVWKDYPPQQEVWIGMYQREYEQGGYC